MAAEVVFTAGRRGGGSGNRKSLFCMHVFLALNLTVNLTHAQVIYEGVDADANLTCEPHS